MRKFGVIAAIVACGATISAYGDPRPRGTNPADDHYRNPNPWTAPTGKERYWTFHPGGPGFNMPWLGTIRLPVIDAPPIAEPGGGGPAPVEPGGPG